MNVLFKNLLAGIILAYSAIFLMSCENKTEKPVPTPVNLDTYTFSVANTEGSKTSIKLNMPADWTISNDQKWFRVSPMSGSAGENAITVEVLKLNDCVTEKVSTFNVRINDKTIPQYVIQDGKSSLDVTPSELLFQSSAETKEVQIEGNLPFTITQDADWIKTELVQPDSTVLADGKTKSKYMISKLSVTISDIQDKFTDAGNIVIETPDFKDTIVVAVKIYNVDFSKQFLRKSLFMKFTATQCSYCPYMEESLNEAIKLFPDHIVPFSLYAIYSDGGLGYGGSDVFAQKFNIEGFPTGIMNEYCTIQNDAGTDKIIAEIAKEAVEKCPSKTAIAGTFLSQNGELKANLSIAAKEAGDYKISAFVLESGVVAPQLNGGNDYVHNNVVRKEITNIWGDDVTLSANQVTELTLTAPVPKNVKDASNISLVAFITYEGSYKGEVKGIKYTKFGTIVDNVSVFNVNSEIDFEYEK